MPDIYSVIYRGDIAPGFTLVQVRQGFQDMFSLDDQKLGQLFSGRPVAIKKNLDYSKAEQFCALLAGFGAVAQIRGAESSAPSDAGDAAGQPTREEDGITIAPAGADVLTDDQRRQVPPRQVTTEHLSLDAVGADVLRPEERKSVEAPAIDLSHLKVEPADDSES